MDDLPFLSTFLRIHDLGSVTRAAAALHRTQPTVTYQLRRLEATVGQPLFLRQAGRLVPTPFADRLYALALGFVRDVAVLSQAEGGGPPHGRLELASVSAFGRYLLFPALQGPEFSASAITLRFPIQEEVVQAVVEARVDAGFVYQAPVDARLEAIPVFEETLELIANRSWARRLRLPADAKDLPIVTYDDGDYVVGRWFGYHFGRKMPRWTSVAHFEDIEEVLAWVACGRGLAIVPGFCAQTPLARGRVHRVRWGRPPLVNSVFALLRRGIPPHPLVDRLLKTLQVGGS